jgi:hypothetical protein
MEENQEILEPFFKVGLVLKMKVSYWKLLEKYLQDFGKDVEICFIMKRSKGTDLTIVEGRVNPQPER